MFTTSSSASISGETISCIPRVKRRPLTWRSIAYAADEAALFPQQVSFGLCAVDFSRSSASIDVRVSLSLRVREVGNERTI